MTSYIPCRTTNYGFRLAAPKGGFWRGELGDLTQNLGKPSHQGTVALGGIVAKLGLTTYSIRSITFKEADHHPGTLVDNCVEKLLVRNNKSNIN